MAQIRTNAVTEEHALGRLAAGSALANDPEQKPDEKRDGVETPEPTKPEEEA